MICLYYNPETQSYNLAAENELMAQPEAGIVSIIEMFDVSSQRLAHRVCANLNLARAIF